jgi:hypothetical protein
MKMNGKHEVLAHIARRGLLLAALLAMVLSSPSIIRAQSTEPAAPAQSARPVAGSAAANQAPVAAAKPSAVPAKAESPEKESASKGPQEGIKVHGHWIIEVKNPDGTVVSHREFDNNLVTTPNGTRASGSQALVILLSGTASVATFVGGAAQWGISLLSQNNGDVSPCPATINICFMLATVTPPTNTTITNLNAAGVAALPNQLILSGSTTARQSGTIDTVATSFPLLQNGQVENVDFSSATLPQPNSGTCGAANQPPCAVSVQTNQTISVTVNYSFQ